MTEDIEEIKEEQPLVSVVIPTYNRSKELARAIKSVLNQTYQGFEILVVDDGSEEDLRVVCDSFNDQRIKFLRNDNHTNANVARNRGIKEARGEYIAMLDSDDEYLPHHLSRRIEKIREWDCDGIFGSAILRQNETEQLYLSRPRKDNEKMSDYLLGTGGATTPSHFYKRNSALDILWAESLNRHQDLDFSIRFAAKYRFISDYLPTVVNNWEETQNPKIIDLTSCIHFLEKYKNEINPKILAKYILDQSFIARRQSDYKALD